jgi:iron complex outermembrane recepter protein
MKIGNRRFALSTRAASTLVMGAAGLAVTTVSMGQSTGSEGPIETVEVTGIRAGIEQSIELKRNSSSVVEAISAEDLGKLPDTSIADSISRLPGLTSQRAEGRASAISLRGTDPAFTTALLNGREQVSTGDNRSIEFDQYPSELLSAVVVYKTPDAELVGQGLAGTIDLRTTRPLDYGKRAMAFNIRGELNSNNDLGANSDDNGYRASFSYINQFLDNTLGVTFGYAHLESALATRGSGTYEPFKTNGTPTLNPQNPTAIVNPGVGPDVFITDGIKVRSDLGENRRDGALASLEWRPNDNFRSLVDVYYTRRRQENNARSLEINLGRFPACCDNPLIPNQGGGVFPAGTVFGFSNPTIVDNTVVGGTINNATPLARNFLFKTQDQIMAFGLKNEWSTGAWTFISDLSFSKAKRNEQQFETNAQIAPLPLSIAPPGTPRNIYDTGVFSVGRNRMPQVSFGMDYSDPTRVQVGPTIYGAGYSKIPRVTDELKSARFDVGRELDNDWFSGVLVGVNYADREKDKLQPEGSLRTRIDPATGKEGFFQVSDQHLLAPTNLGYAGAGRVLAYDVAGVLRDFYQPIEYGNAGDPGFGYLIGKNWSVEEKITTAFVKVNLDRTLTDSIQLKGNIGVQLAETDQSSQALTQVNGTSVVPFTDGKKYSDVLPAVNLAFLLPADQTFRIGIARELARARMDQLKASSEFGVNSGTGMPSGSGGNPKLDPWRADAFDISYEKYFDDRNATVSLAGFYKELKSYIFNQTNGNFDFSQFLTTLPPNFLQPGVVAQTTGNFSQPVNGQGGLLKGLELAFSLTGELFTERLAGFGTIFSIAKTRSSITLNNSPGSDFAGGGNSLGSIPLPGLSETVWSATLYYERAGFSTRVATRARSKYIGEVTNFANDRAFRFVKDDRITDAQVGYEFSSGRFEGMSLLFQINNITNEPYIAYSTIETRLQDYQEYGRQYLLGVNYRL